MRGSTALVIVLLAMAAVDTSAQRRPPISDAASAPQRPAGQVTPAADSLTAEVAAQLRSAQAVPQTFRSRSPAERQSLARTLGAVVPTEPSSYTITPLPGGVRGHWQLAASRVGSYLPMQNELGFYGSDSGQITLMLFGNSDRRYLVDCDIRTEMRHMNVYVLESDGPVSTRTDQPVVDGRLSIITLVSDAPILGVVISRSSSYPPAIGAPTWTFRGCEVTPLPR